MTKDEVYSEDEIRQMGCKLVITKLDESLYRPIKGTRGHGMFIEEKIKNTIHNLWIQFGINTIDGKYDKRFDITLFKMPQDILDEFEDDHKELIKQFRGMDKAMWVLNYTPSVLEG